VGKTTVLVAIGTLILVTMFLAGYGEVESVENTPPQKEFLDYTESWTLIFANLAVVITLIYEIHSRRSESEDQYERIEVLEKQLRQYAYIKLRSDHIAQSELMLKDDTLRKVYTLGKSSDTDWSNLTNEEKKKIILFLMMELDLYDRIYWEFDEGHIPADEWVLWLIWLRKLSQSPLFEVAFNELKSAYYGPPMKAIEKNIMKNETFCPLCNKPESDLNMILNHLDEEHKDSKFKVKN
jgi:hypothetical protein